MFQSPPTSTSFASVIFRLKPPLKEERKTRGFPATFDDTGGYLRLPSGKRVHNDRKSHDILMGKSWKINYFYGNVQ